MNKAFSRYERLIKLVSEYYKEFFDELYVKAQACPFEAVIMRGKVNGVEFHHTFLLVEYDSHFDNEIEYHALENIKGLFVRQIEQKKGR